MTIPNKHIDPALNIFDGVPLMMTNNTDQKKGLGNSTIIIGLSIQFKKGLYSKLQNSGRKTDTYSVMVGC